MIQRFEIFNCTNTKKHKDNVWVQMKVGQFEPERRISLYCPQCDNSIAIDYSVMQGYILMSSDVVEVKDGDKSCGTTSSSG